MITTILHEGLLRLRITEKCNARCIFCGQQTTTEYPNNKEMPPEWLYKYCVPLYSRVKKILLTGGECTIAKEALPFCIYISQNHPEITLFIESNGIAFDQQWQELAANNLFQTHFSVNAANTETFQNGVWPGESGKIAHTSTIRNISNYIQLLKKKKLLVFAPSISMVINKHTACDIYDFVKMALQWDVSGCVFYFDNRENDMSACTFSFPEISIPALKELLKIERVLANRFFIYFHLRLPLNIHKTLQNEIDSIPISLLEKEYATLLLLAKNRSMSKEYTERQYKRIQKEKKTYSFAEEWWPTLHEIALAGKNICFAPWKLLDIYPDGYINVCSWREPTTLKIQDYIINDAINWDEILTTDTLEMIRKNMLDNNYSGCMDCCPLNPTKHEITPLHKHKLEWPS